MASRIVGGAKFRRALKRLPADCRDEVAEALDTSIKLVQQTAAALAPVDTGVLRAALLSRRAVGKRDKGLRVEFGLRTKALQRKAFYAPFVEYGTKGYTAGSWRTSGKDQLGRQKYKRVRKQVAARPARPFMRPALDLNLPKVRRLVNGAVRSAIRRAGRG